MSLEWWIFGSKPNEQIKLELDGIQRSIQDWCGLAERLAPAFLTCNFAYFRFRKLVALHAQVSILNPNAKLASFAQAANVWNVRRASLSISRSGEAH